MKNNLKEKLPKYTAQILKDETTYKNQKEVLKQKNKDLEALYKENKRVLDHNVSIQKKQILEL